MTSTLGVSIVIANLPAIVTTAGLVFDIAGAILVANEVVNVFRGPATIDVGNAGGWNGSTRLVPNPEFEKRDVRKRKWMLAGLIFLFIGFSLQGVGAWLPIWYPVPACEATAQAKEEPGKPNPPVLPR